jgi:hypothetical protein
MDPRLLLWTPGFEESIHPLGLCLLSVYGEPGLRLNLAGANCPSGNACWGNADRYGHTDFGTVEQPDPASRTQFCCFRLHGAYQIVDAGNCL